MATYTADIVVYGGSFAGVSAAAKAANNAKNKKVYLIVPDVSGKLGSIGTAGGQNYFDERNWNKPSGGTIQVQQGSYGYYKRTHGRFYNTNAMSDTLRYCLNKTKYPNLELLEGYDIINVSCTTSPYKINSLTIRRLKRDASGRVIFDASYGNDSISGKVFIDASDDGHLSRLSGNYCGTTGRYDWPAYSDPGSPPPNPTMTSDEQDSTRRARQQAATLMFQIKDVSTLSTDNNIAWGTFNGVNYGDGKAKDSGGNYFTPNSLIYKFNEKYASQGYAIKPLNIAQNGAGKPEYWINCLLVFDVDGRARYRDLSTARYPTDIRSGYKNVDDAWVAARDFITSNSELMPALRSIPSFANAKLVTDASGKAVIGDMLYLRETIHHAKNSSSIGVRTENSNYWLTASACNNAGSTSTSGSDTSNYSSRIGLAYYWTDINAYRYADLKSTSGNYIWGTDLFTKLRPAENLTGNSPNNPVYLPYNMLLTGYVANLLVPGYATSASSFSWSELRVIPNLCVLGDAAGVAAAYAINNSKEPLYLDANDIVNVQNILKTTGEALLDK